MQFKWLSPIIVVLALMLAVGMVAAQDEEATAEPEAAETTETSETSFFGMRHGGPGGFGFRMDALEDATGLSATELRTALADGSTLTELIEANGEDVDALIAEVLAEHEARLTQAVENGRLTQEEADTRLAEFESNLTAWVNGELEMPFVGGFPGRGSSSMNALAEATGLSATELRTALADGATLAELIEANGGDVNALIAEVLAEHEARLTQAVENGRLTQEVADAQLAAFEVTVTAWVNGEIDAPFMGGMPGDGFPGDGFGGRGGRGGRGGGR